MTANLSVMAKPATDTDQTTISESGHPGSWRTARIQGETRGTWEILTGMKHETGMHNRLVACKEVGGIHSSEETG